MPRPVASVRLLRIIDSLVGTVREGEAVGPVIGRRGLLSRGVHGGRAWAAVEADRVPEDSWWAPRA